jgi:hypothetical protein
MGAAPRVAQDEYSTGDEDLARKTTGKPRDPKPVDAELPKDGAAPEPEAPVVAEPEATAPVDPTPSDRIEDAEIVSETPPDTHADAETDTAAPDDTPQPDAAPMDNAGQRMHPQNLHPPWRPPNPPQHPRPAFYRCCWAAQSRRPWGMARIC